MKILKSKKAKFFILMVSISAIFVMIAALFIIGMKMDAEPIGKRAFSIISNYQAVEGALIYLDSAMWLAGQQAIFNLGISHKTDCNIYLGFTSWSDAEKECPPQKTELEKELLKIIEGEINNYLPSYREERFKLESNYLFSILEPFTLIGIPNTAVHSGGKVIHELTETPVLTASQEELKEKIIKKANKLGIPKDVALALAYTESKFQHSKDGKVLISPSFDVGLFQINIKTHRDCAVDDEKVKRELKEKGYLKGKEIVKVDGICITPECEKKTIADVDCNIAAGLNLLKYYYDTSPSTLVYCKDTPLERTYTDRWDIALRKYNGVGCGAGFAQYVEKVNVNRRAFV